MEFVDVPYSSTSSYHKFDLYVPNPTSPPPSPLICFVHGGAWRSEDKADHAAFARRLALNSNSTVAVPNYRLTPQEPTAQNTFCHPGHAQDILECLSFLTSWKGLPGLGNLYDPQSIHLIGHSCAAHMLSCIFLDSSLITPSLSPPAPVLQSVKSIALSEGIYDLDRLLARFPNYRSWFVEPAFGRLNSYSEYSVTNYPLRRPDIRWLLVHSVGDSLVDIDQSRGMYEHLHRVMEGYGERVASDFHSIQGEHNDIFENDKFVELLARFTSEN